MKNSISGGGGGGSDDVCISCLCYAKWEQTADASKELMIDIVPSHLVVSPKTRLHFPIGTQKLNKNNTLHGPPQIPITADFPIEKSFIMIEVQNVPD
ncbi:hypothetical protein Tco_0717368 [Tanacetum coccineum]